jgi:hypothetical protein
MTHKELSKSNADGALEHLQSIAFILGAAITKDECGNAAILGRSINSIHASHQGKYFILASHDAKGSFNAAKRRLDKFCTPWQCADTEGCFILDRLPTKAEARTLRSALGIRKAKTVDAALRSKLLANLEKTPNK